MMLFAIIFVVVTVAVGVIKTPSKYSKLPHTLNLLLSISDLFGRISHTIRSYVKKIVARGTSLLGMNGKVFFTLSLFQLPETIFQIHLPTI